MRAAVGRGKGQASPLILQAHWFMGGIKPLLLTLRRASPSAVPSALRYNSTDILTVLDHGAASSSGPTTKGYSATFAKIQVCRGSVSAMARVPGYTPTHCSRLRAGDACGRQRELDIRTGVLHPDGCAGERPSVAREGVHGT